MFNSIKRNLTEYKLKRKLTSKHFALDDSIVIFGEARSGSTWLMEMLKALPRTCINWEPLHVDKGVIPEKYRFGWRPFIPSDSESNDYSRLFRNILTFRISNQWTQKFLKEEHIPKGQYVITKFVRANLLIPYIISQFTFNHKPIFLIRHPIDVCFSRLKEFNKDQRDEQKIMVPDVIHNDRFVEHHEYLKTLESSAEIEIALWCINNVSIIHQLPKLPGVQTVFYSDLIISPEKEMDRIISGYDIKMNKEKVLNRMKFRKASKSNFSQELKESPSDQLQKNYQNMNPELQSRIQDIFDHFNFKLYSAYSPYPNKNTLH